MTVRPLVHHIHCTELLCASSSFGRRLRFLTMSSQSHLNSAGSQLEDDSITNRDYPVPLSPPLPHVSKRIELNRALIASSKSSLFSLSRSDVLFEDEWLIAINKPSGIYCESVLSAAPALPGVSNHSGMEESNKELHLANRLDRDTSGVMLITKLHKVAAKLVKAFTDHKVKKTYVALSIGRAPEWENIKIKSGHGRSKHGVWRVYAASDVGKVLPGGSFVRDMETFFQVLSINGQRQGHVKDVFEPLNEVENSRVVELKSEVGCDVKKDEVLVRAYPKSGRTHQIRLHCQYLGIPIRGDVKYEGVYEWKNCLYDGHALHAESLSFEHPVTAEHVVIQAPLPLWACGSSICV